MQEELEDFPYHTLQPYSTNTDFSNLAVCDKIQEQLQSEIRFDMTSVHDVSLRDAWSKVIQGILGMLPEIEQLLIDFTSVSENQSAMQVRHLTSFVDVGDGQFVSVRPDFRGSPGRR